VDFGDVVVVELESVGEVLDAALLVVGKSSAVGGWVHRVGDELIFDAWCYAAWAGVETGVAETEADALLAREPRRGGWHHDGHV